MSKSKRIISLVLSTVILTSATVTVGAESQNVNKNNYQKFYAKPVTTVTDSGLMYNNIKFPEQQTYFKSRATLPASYSSADNGYVTSVKDQGNTGTCWAHSALSACESSLIKQNGQSKNTDLSELHLTYALYNTKYDRMGMLDSVIDSTDRYFLSMGGNPADAMFTLANWQGVVSEGVKSGQFSSKKMHLDGADAFEIYNKETMYQLNEAVLTNCYRVPLKEQATVKQLIMEYGSGTINFNASGLFYNYENSTFYCYDEDINGVNHEVALVGWDDNYPKENCTVDGYTPSKNGAWLVKNSWGTEIGNDGYFWISYEDKSINQYPSNFYALDTTEKYNNNYQYDDLSNETVLSNSPNELGIKSDGYMANVFTAKNDNEVLKAVSFVTSNPNVEYKIDVYTNVSSIPTDGTLVSSLSGNMKITGLHTLDLETPVSLTKGSKFSVVVYLGDSSNPDRTMFYNVDSAHTDNETKMSEYGESFFSYDGAKWEDLKESIDANFRIKAFTTSDMPEVTEQYYYASYNGVKRLDHINNLKALVAEYSTVVDSLFVYSNDSLTKFTEKYIYASSASESSTTFQSIELYYIAEELKQAYNQLEPYNMADEYDYYYDTIVENVEYYDTLPKWDEFISTYNSIIKEAESAQPDLEYIESQTVLIEPIFIEYMTCALNHGSAGTLLQKFGDVDNSNDINIQDATLTQMYVAKQKEMDYYISYNGDVDGDGEVNIKDATNIQMMVAKLLNYFPIYDIDLTTDIYNSERPKNEVTYDSALAKLQTAVTKLENHPYFEFLSLLKQDVSILTVLCLYDDAKAVLSNPSEYSPQEMNFKAQYLFLWLNVLYNM